MGNSVVGFVLLLLAMAAEAAELPANAADKHMGVATCASGVCHGSVQPLDATNVLQNEFVTWTREDKHAGAYALLLNDQSKSIANKLGLANAHEAEICLDCHTDNIPPEKRGEKFQLADGIGCEACHGGGERWLSSHTSNASHADNLAQGMYPTEDLNARASLCLSCHLGNDEKFATHRIMGAGHPRLAFELDTFGVLQPQHYRLDTDYSERKGNPGSVKTWIAGLVAASTATLDLIGGSRLNNDQLFPEIALFDCHACHHLMNDQRWQARAATAGAGPGAVRLNDANFVLLSSVSEVVAPTQHQQLTSALRNLHNASVSSRQSLLSATGNLRSAVEAVGAVVSNTSVGDGDLRRIASRLFRDGAGGQYRDYAAAEQATMGVDLLLIAMGVRDQHKGAIDRLYGSVQDEHRFRAGEFVAQLAALQRSTGL